MDASVDALPREPSPKIEDVSWGRVRVRGETFKDVKLYPGGAREWDWNETGTRHEPGIQPADVEELLARGARHVVLSRGMHERLQVREDTLSTLRDRGVSVDVLETNRAVARYNELSGSEAVGALIHSTC